MPAVAFVVAFAPAAAEAGPTTLGECRPSLSRSNQDPRSEAEDRRLRREASKKRELSRLGGYNHSRSGRSGSSADDDSSYYGARSSGRNAASASAARSRGQGGGGGGGVRSSGRRARGGAVDYTYASYEKELDQALRRGYN